VNILYLKDKYVDWKTITRGFDLGCLDDVINLWNTMEEKKEVAWIINDTSSFPIKENNRILRFLNRYMLAEEDDSGDRCAEPSWGYGDPADYNARMAIMNIEKLGLKNRISELEAENESLKALLEKKKSSGTARKFTLIEIVNYCKGRVEWDDAKDIVAMLNNLLRNKSTQEDSDLVDSIEEEFKNRKSGDSVSGNKHSVGDNSNMVNMFFSSGADYDKVSNAFNALPDEIKNMLSKQLTQQDNG